MNWAGWVFHTLRRICYFSAPVSTRLYSFTRPFDTLLDSGILHCSPRLMPKHVGYAPLDNHAARSTLHTAVNVQTVQSVTHNNRRNLARYSRHTASTGLVQPSSTAALAPPTAQEFYATPGPYNDDFIMDEAPEGPATIAGPSGITIVPKHKAKRYENSVCDMSPMRSPMADLIFRMCLCAHLSNGATHILMSSWV